VPRTPKDAFSLAIRFSCEIIPPQFYLSYVNGSQPVEVPAESVFNKATAAARLASN
jgi:hypothetical protein